MYNDDAFNSDLDSPVEEHSGKVTPYCKPNYFWWSSKLDNDKDSLGPQPHGSDKNFLALTYICDTLLCASRFPSQSGSMMSCGIKPRGVEPQFYGWRGLLYFTINYDSDCGIRRNFLHTLAALPKLYPPVRMILSLCSVAKGNAYHRKKNSTGYSTLCFVLCYASMRVGRLRLWGKALLDTLGWLELF